MAPKGDYPSSFGHGENRALETGMMLLSAWSLIRVFFFFLELSVGLPAPDSECGSHSLFPGQTSKSCHHLWILP
jgi:hypothetical protein